MKTKIYRVWNSKYKIFDDDIWMYQSGILDHDCDNTMKFCIVQFNIGGKDITGKSIFEGDIIEWEGPHDSIFRGEVIYNCEKFKYECIAIHNDNRPHYDLLTVSNIKIIGNNFENPNLLPE